MRTSFTYAGPYRGGGASPSTRSGAREDVRHVGGGRCGRPSVLLSIARVIGIDTNLQVKGHSSYGTRSVDVAQGCTVLFQDGYKRSAARSYCTYGQRERARLRTDGTSRFEASPETRLPSGRPLTHSAVDQIEKGTRRVDVDDLMALAAALEVSPITLLMPAEADSSTIVDATGVGGGVSAERLWDWLNASNPLRGAVMTFWADALPPWMSAELARQMGSAMGGLLDQLRAPRGTHGDD